MMSPQSLDSHGGRCLARTGSFDGFGWPVTYRPGPLPRNAAILFRENAGNKRGI
jgi:hypothetical protein